ncbi:hypothetical protein RZE82_06400 [Mollicutes bacterium LVI A0039]|nr:hypothetical protein RZE82_06400 [Mollicutes bacterium LVI A0039]
MKSLFSFIFGAALATLIILMLGNQEVVEPIVEETSSVENSIALVNLDTGIEGKELNIAQSMINNLYEPEEYELVSTTLDKAKRGVEGDSYAAYIIFDANYSQSIYGAISEELPSKSKIQYKVNENLTSDERNNVKNILLKEMFYIDNTTNYMFITYLLNTLHYSQEDVSAVLENEGYVKQVMAGVHEYNEKANKKATSYIENKNDVEVELDTTVIDELYEANLKAIEDSFDIDTKELQERMITNQQQLNTGLQGYMTSPDLNVDEFDQPLDEISSEVGELTLDKDTETSQLLLEMLNSSVEYRVGINDEAAQLSTELETLNTVLSSLKSSEEVELFTTIETIGQLIEQQNVEELQMYLNENEIARLIVDFQEDYQYWLANPDSCDEALDDPLGCMKPFLENPDNELLKSEYDEFKNPYLNIEAYSHEYFEQLYAELQAQSSALPEDYDSYVEMMPFADIQLAYRATKDYCRANGEDNLSGFVCSWLSTTDRIRQVYDQNVEVFTNYNNEVVTHKDYTQTYNNQTQEYIKEKNQTIATNNQQAIEVLLLDQQKQIESIQMADKTLNEKIDLLLKGKNEEIDKINQGKDKYTLETSEKFTNLERNINEMLDSEEKAKLESSLEIQEHATSYIASYPKLVNSLTANQESLGTFEQLMSNTKNSNDANYYIYDYLSNPLEIRDETGEIINTTVVVEPESNLNKIIFLSAIILLSAVGYLFYLGKKDVEI